MKLLIYGNNTEEIKHLVQEAGLDIVIEDPDVVAVCGGDGTFMKSEKDFPGVPKFIIKKSKTSKKGHDLTPEEIIEKLVRGRYHINEEIKIEATAKEEQLIGLNEIIIHNTDPRQAIRYNVFVNGKQVAGEIIGDGVVISTPYGSTGYYRSITDGMFEVGMGIAFNNSTEQVDHMVLKEDTKIKIKIVRGVAHAYADNDEKEIKLNDGDEINITKYIETAKIIYFN